jgi:hypothetical protein
MEYDYFYISVKCGWKIGTRCKVGGGTNRQQKTNFLTESANRHVVQLDYINGSDFVRERGRSDRAQERSEKTDRVRFSAWRWPPTRASLETYQ